MLAMQTLCRICSEPAINSARQSVTIHLKSGRGKIQVRGINHKDTKAQRNTKGTASEVVRCGPLCVSLCLGVFVVNPPDLDFPSARFEVNSYGLSCTVNCGLGTDST